MAPSTTSSASPRPATAHAADTLAGSVTAPGDKSISHRTLMLASQALGTTTISGLLEGEDVLSTAEALRQCGVSIERANGVWTVKGLGIGGLHEPEGVLDMGNAGTACRLMMGLLASYPYNVQFTGDASLRKRPMQRVITPLSEMGAEFWAREGGRLPLAMKGRAELVPIDYTLPVASAQVKSAILLAALNTRGTSTVIEKEATRDHTERMLRFFGIDVDCAKDKDGATRITLAGQQTQTYQDRTFEVPADPSSAAFPLVAALIVPGSEVTVTRVCLNPLRTGLFDTLKEMGADLTVSNQRDIGGETVGDITARHSKLKAVEVPAARAPSMIDEYPILAVAAAFAKGTSTMRGLAELRVKESDRLAAIITGLAACGVRAEAKGDDLIVHGASEVAGGGSVTTHYDHRIAMSFLILGFAAKSPVTVDDTRAIATSFPDFMKLMQGIGADISPPPERGRVGWGSAADQHTSATHTEPHQTPTLTLPLSGGGKRIVIAVDGPAASGKGTLARRLADHFGVDYLDTGLLYRAVAMRVLYKKQEPTDTKAAAKAASSLKSHDLSNPKLRGERVAQAASIVSAIPEVRAALLEYQRSFAAKDGGAVLDGRDIGTVVCPQADVKLFITASIGTRAHRRQRQLEGFGFDIESWEVEADLRERDARDAARAVAPLKAAPDAIVVDTTDMSANEVFEKTLQLVKKRLAAKG